jgi:hypothetical protein
MFENIKKCLDEYKQTQINVNSRNLFEHDITEEEWDVLQYFDLHFAKAIMKDLEYDNDAEKVAKIILAAKGLSNEVKIKVE